MWTWGDGGGGACVLLCMCAMQADIERVSIFGNAAENKLLIVKLGGLDQLIRQMGSPNVEVQCNAVGCITNLATHGT